MFIIASYITTDISVPSFPNIAHYFGVSDGMVQLTIAFNLLGFCVGVLLFGPLSESYGRRKAMIIGNSLLLMGSVSCAFTSSIYWLLASCFIQGFGASASAVVFAVIADVYHGNKAIKFIGIINAVTTIVLAAAPVSGSLINEIIGWRGNYGTLAIICLISWILLFFALPETKKNREILNFRKVIKDYKRLFLNTKFLGSSLVISLFCSAYMSFITCAPFLYTETLGLPNVIYALHQGVIIASYSLVALFSGKISEKLGSRRCVITGTAITVIGSLLITLVSIITPNFSYSITLSMVIMSVGFAICQGVIFNAAINIFSEIKGTASSAIGFIRSFLMSVFIALTSYIYNGHAMSMSLFILFIITLQFIMTVFLLRSSEYCIKMKKECY
ncbi:multidrug effflux MFS transporter [Wolbachia endosymbiont of Chironomus riparius]|uniref:multidrug effflux MFS transporter n=1 Tax=Wolbachia endosymbiont of Chironomus riparius TaxID=2883238 RepID=UPI00209CA3D0|nr:multidrug effflux MFS transporter [Wolbachia endosymbiont of Chironomus riparius]